MAGYLERYQGGEHEAVWQELTSLGGRVRIEPLLGEARAVAQETMRRARHNIERLVERLHQIGFQFQDPEAVFLPTTPQQLADLDALEHEIGPAPLSLRAWAEQVGTVNFMGAYLRLSYYAGDVNPLGQLRIGGAAGQPGETIDLDDLLRQTPSDGVPSQLVDALKSLQGLSKLIPNLGFEADGPPPSKHRIPEDEQAVSDPLVVDLHQVSLDAYLEWREYGDSPTYQAIIAPDIFHKANFSGGGGYEITLPDAGMDAPLLYTEWGDLTFVDYLRLSFEWAGFPGLQDFEHRDEALLAALREGLLPL
jgi:hypothetical protein